MSVGQHKLNYQLLYNKNVFIQKEGFSVDTRTLYTHAHFIHTFCLYRVYGTEGVESLRAGCYSLLFLLQGVNQCVQT